MAKPRDPAKATLATCSRCAKAVLRATDAETGMRVIVDSDPLPVDAVLDGKKVYRRHHAGWHELIYNNERDGWPLHSRHVCTKP